MPEPMDIDERDMGVKWEMRDAIKELVEQQKIANQLTAYTLAGYHDIDEIASITRGMRAFPVRGE